VRNHQFLKLKSSLSSLHPLTRNVGSPFGFISNKKAMKGRSDGGQKKRLIALVCVAAVVLVFVYLFYGSSDHRASAIEYGRKLGLGGDDDDTKQDDTSSSFGIDDGFTPRSFPVSLLEFFLNDG